MRSTPRTAVRRTVPALRPQWVIFLWSRTGPPLTAARRAHLDHQWASFDLLGGIVLLIWTNVNFLSAHSTSMPLDAEGGTGVGPRRQAQLLARQQRHQRRRSSRCATRWRRPSGS